MKQGWVVTHSGLPSIAKSCGDWLANRPRATTVVECRAGLGLRRDDVDLAIALPVGERDS